MGDSTSLFVPLDQTRSCRCARGPPMVPLSPRRSPRSSRADGSDLQAGPA